MRKFSLDEIFGFAKEKYPHINLYYSLRSLSYFEDIKEDKGERKQVKIFDEDYSWEKVRQRLAEEAKRYQLAMFRR